MSIFPNSPSLKSKVLYTKYLQWRQMKFIQQDDFKSLPQAAKEKLKASLVANQFTQPFYVWQDPSDQTIYCLDGRHRTLVLEELIAEGHDIPDDLPATFINCADKKEAARLVLVYSSIYARITETGLTDFAQLYDLNLEELNISLDLPGIKLPDAPGMEVNAFDDPGVGVKNQYGVIVMCTGEESQRSTYNKLVEEGFDCRVVVT